MRRLRDRYTYRQEQGIVGMLIVFIAALLVIWYVPLFLQVLAGPQPR